LRRKISWLIIVAFTAAFAAVNHGCSGSSSLDPDQPDPNFNIDTTSFKDRLGDDDGYSMALFFGGDIHGSLETCG
jgi:hypothetical protein